MTRTGTPGPLVLTGVCALACLLLMALLASGCANVDNGMMMKTERISAPEPGKALVTFVNISPRATAFSFAVWDGEELVGVLDGGTCTERQVAPGEHYFLGQSENWSCVKADLAANKHYVVRLRWFTGLARARVALLPVTAADYKSGQFKNAGNWLAQFPPVTLDPQKIESYAQPRRAQVREAKSSFQAGKGQYETLTAQDCMP